MSKEEICTEFRDLVEDSECRVFDPPPSDWAMVLVYPLAATAALAVLILFCVLGRRVQNELRKKRKLEEDRQRRSQELIECAEDELKELGYPMALVSARVFLSLDKLVHHESLRDKGLLVVLDSLRAVFEFKMKNLIVFLSHQWLGLQHPDPHGVQYSAMRHAVTEIVRRGTSLSTLRDGGVALGCKFNVTVDTVYIWCDYASIAQMHRQSQMLAVGSLPVYASEADVFVIVAPAATHANTCLPCNVDTYNARGWCRAEILSKVCSTGLEQTYLSTGCEEGIEPMTQDLLDRLDLKVFDGNFSCCALGHRCPSGANRYTICDKQHLMRPMLGLYSLMLRKSDCEGVQAILNYIENAKAAFFPETFQFKKGDSKCEERELFGPLVGMMEQYVMRPESSDLVARRSYTNEARHSYHGHAIQIDELGTLSAALDRQPSAATAASEGCSAMQPASTSPPSDEQPPNDRLKAMQNKTMIVSLDDE
mmetsp:Transcript_75361/g.218868  ORF Transcript_75361/g.218868 Transcript_75361/m.218868 type:complete len:480 (+) Transcript_75361:2-1441(+)